MAYKKKTLRRMSPTARKVARLAGECESIARRLKNLIPELQRLDLDAKALETAKQSNIERESLRKHLGTIQAVSSITYSEIHNIDAINHTINLVNEHATKALEILG
jgi:hypothetical protein